MNAHTERRLIDGPAGALECAIDKPATDDALRGVAVVAHPHPLHGGSLDNKVAQTLARAFVALGFQAVRFNFRGVGASAGQFDEGLGETADLLAVVAAFRRPELPLALAGFSFGGFVAAQAATQLRPACDRLVLVGPAASRFALPVVPAGTLVLHGEADEVVPLQAVLDWARPQTLPVTVLPGVGHFFHGQLSLLKDLVVRSWQA